MSLYPPKIDSRTFQEIVDDLKRTIAQRCPEWTYHGPSDPGVTLIEAFAELIEVLIAEVNDVPMRSHIQLLELIGLTPQPPEAAIAELRFLLVRPITDANEVASDEVVVPAGSIVSNNSSDESSGVIEFSTDKELRLLKPNLNHVISIPAGENTDWPEMAAAFMANESRKRGFQIFAEVPNVDDACYFGLESEISGSLLQLSVECTIGSAVGMNNTYPSQVWEVWSATSSKWERLIVVSDSTAGLSRSGSLVLQIPATESCWRLIAGRRASWIRCRYTMNSNELPPMSGGNSPAIYARSPEILSVAASVIGGMVSASHCELVGEEYIGQSDGSPGQVFRLACAPILRLRDCDGLIVEIDEKVSGGRSREVRRNRWTQVQDFSRSGPDDQHYLIDFISGEIYLGPELVEADGLRRCYGAVPPRGAILRFSSYRTGGGSKGNVRAGKLRHIRTPHTQLSEVTNPLAAFGGRDAETVDQLKMRTRELLRVRDRAVTAEDFELLAQMASSAVARACCIQSRTEEGGVVGGIPGTIEVLLVPWMPDHLLNPQPSDLEVPSHVKEEVLRFLDERRLLSTLLLIREPKYVFVSVEVRAIADPKFNSNAVSQKLRETLNNYLHPLRGGVNGTGWPFGHSLTLVDLYGRIGSVPGIGALISVEVFASRVEGVLSNATRIPRAIGPLKEVRLEPGDLICGLDHSVTFVPMTYVGR